MNGRDAVIFLVGIGLGAGGAYLLLNENFEKKIDEEVEAYKQYQEEKEKPVNGLDAMDTDELDEEEILEIEKRAYQDYTKKYKSPDEIVKEKYHGDDVIDAYEEGPSEDDSEEDYPRRIYGSGEYPEPYIIDPDEFEEGAPHYDKITISYYELDDTLADEQEEIIPDIDGVVGMDALYSFGRNPEDPDVVHVRNERLASDYEICRMNLSYTEHVLGIIEDRPRPPRRRKNDEEPN